MRFAATELFSACASVLATTNSTPSISAFIILPIALPPAPPTPNTVMRGRSSSIAGGPPEHFRDYLKREHAKYGKLVRDAGIKGEALN